ncbi:MAG: hypothetical protein QHH75_10710 [Bacillota bacterium]|nr:hypothetical protein [Bacillota bacterium]
MKIYIASSFRNAFQQKVVKLLREQSYEVYDFVNPGNGVRSFHWSEIDPDWESWSARDFRKALTHYLAESSFYSDITALMECDVCLLVLPCGRSAHLEAGCAIGAGKPTIILLSDRNEPELSYKMTPYLCVNMDEVIKCLKSIEEASSRTIGTRAKSYGGLRYDLQVQEKLQKMFLLQGTIVQR